MKFAKKYNKNLEIFKNLKNTVIFKNIKKITKILW